MRRLGYLLGLIATTVTGPVRGETVAECQWSGREEQIQRLRTEPFDVLIVGGGATGAGVAVDAATRGLKTALVERDDFAAGTSSRSTKLVHGGVRYLEKAVTRLDIQQYALVKEGLKERAVLLENAPHLASRLPLLTPVYKWWQVPYLWVGLKAYDWLSGSRSLGRSEYLSAKTAAERFPMLKKEGLVGAVVYYDGQFNDARVNVSLALTAAREGAVVANHVEVMTLLKAGDHVTGVRVRDALTGKEWDIAAKVVVNATGPYVDHLRQEDDPAATKIVVPSAGTHIVLDRKFSPPDTGLLIPETKDGRVLFLLPWEGGTLAGTTDVAAELEWDPKAGDADVEYILEHLRAYFDVPIATSDVRSRWAGLRPLVRDPKVADTSKLVREHYIEVSDSGLVTVSGGKWTTYRQMAEDTVDRVVAVGGFESATPCVTEHKPLVGAKGYDPSLARELEAEYHLDADVAEYLVHSYGTLASRVATLARQGFGQRLAKGHPYLEAEVVYAVRAEYARTPMDVLMRRTRLYHLDSQAALAAVPRVTQLMAQELAWNAGRVKAEQREATLALR